MESWSVAQNTGLLEPLPKVDWFSKTTLTEPETKPKDTYDESPKKPLALKYKILIGVLVSAIVIVGVVLLVYFLVIRKNDNGNGSQYGSITILDTTKNSSISTTTNATIDFQPGDVLQLTYIASSIGFSNRVVWTVSFDGGKTFPTQISDPSLGNTVKWTIPESTFTQSAVFRVANHDDTSQFVDTSNSTITIDPPFSLVKGPGVIKSGDAVIVGRNVTCTVNTDGAINGIASVIVESSLDPKFSSVSAQTLVSSTLVGDVLTVVWQPVQVESSAYYRIKTNTLVQNGYPYELTAPSTYTIDMKDAVSCSQIAPTSDFTICQVAVIENATGRTNNFDSGSPVTIDFAYVNTFPGSATISYSVDGAAYVVLTPTSGPNVASGIVTYQAVLPTIITNNFVVKVVSGSSTCLSPTYSIDASFLIGSVSSPLNIYPTGTKGVNVTTNVTMSVPSEVPTSWSIGFENTSKQQVFFPVVSSTTPNPQTGAVTLTWVLTWDNLGFTQAGEQHVYPLLFKAVFAYGSVIQSVPSVTFISSNPVISHGQITQNGLALCESDGTNSFSFTSTCTKTWYWKYTLSPSGTACIWSADSPSQTDTCWGLGGNYGIQPTTADDTKFSVYPETTGSCSFDILIPRAFPVATVTVNNDSILTAFAPTRDVYQWQACPV